MQSDEDREASDNARARELAASVTLLCGPRIVRYLADGRWHSVIQFLPIAHRIQDSDITDLFVHDLSDMEIDYAKIDMIATGLAALASNLQVCEWRDPQSAEQDPASAVALANVLITVLGFDAAFMHTEYRIRPDIPQDINLNELEQWTSPGEETSPRTHDQRQLRGIRIRNRTAENDG